MGSVGSIRGQAPIGASVLTLLLFIGGCSTAHTDPSEAPSVSQVEPTATATERSLPTAAPSATASPQDDPWLLVDDLLADWNAGDGQAALAFYDEQAVIELHLNDVEDVIRSGMIGQAIEGRAANGFTITRTGPVIAERRYAAVPMRWTAADGAGDGVVVLELTATGHVLSQIVIGVTSPGAGASALAASQDLAGRVDDAVQAFNARDMGPIGALFADAAVLRFSWDGSGQGWGSQWQVVSGLPAIEAFLQQAQFRVTPLEGALQQGRLLVYPVSITLGGGGRELWVLELDGADRIATWWDLGGP